MKQLNIEINNCLECPFAIEDTLEGRPTSTFRCRREYQQLGKFLHYRYIGHKRDIQISNIIPVWCSLVDAESLLNK